MVEKIKNNPFVILLLITGAVYFFLKYLTPLLAPILTAMLFVTIFGPTLKRLHEKFHIHRQIGAVILLLVAGITLVFLVWILFSWIVGSLPEWIGDLSSFEDEISDVVNKGCEAIGRLIGVNSGYLEEMILGKISDGFSSLRTQVLPGMLSQSMQYVRTAAKIGAFMVTFIIAAVLLAKDYDDIMNRLLDREDCHVFLEVMCGIIRYIATYVKAQLIIMSAIAGAAAVVLGISGIQHGVLWGLLAGLLDALPFVGTGVVMVPLAITQLCSGNYFRAVICILLYIACAFMRELMEPRLIGKKIGVTPVMVLISLYAGIQLFGAWGIIKGPLGFIMIYQSYLSITHKGILG